MNQKTLLLALLVVVLGISAGGYAVSQSVIVTYSLSFQFADAETPVGVVDGINVQFALLAPPSPTTSLILTRNGMIMKQGLDYSLAGSAITFIPAQTPQPGDVLLSWYRFNR